MSLLRQGVNMDANGLLAVLAILVAGYSLLSDEKRLDIHLRIFWFDRIIVGLCVIAIITIVYMPVIKSFDFMVPLPWIFGFSEETSIYACLVAIITFFWLKVSGNKIPRANFSAWAKASERLLREKKFSELGYLFNKYHVQLFKFVDNETWVGNTVI